MSRDAPLVAAIAETRAFHRCLMGDDGRLSADGRLVFAALAKACRVTDDGIMKDNHGRVDAVAHVERDGARSVFRKIEDIMNRPLEDLERRLEEVRNDNE